MKHAVERDLKPEIIRRCPRTRNKKKHTFLCNCDFQFPLDTVLKSVSLVVLLLYIN